MREFLVEWKTPFDKGRAIVLAYDVKQIRKKFRKQSKKHPTRGSDGKIRFHHRLARITYIGDVSYRDHDSVFTREIEQ